MNEVRDICDRMLDVPAPPMRDSTELLEVARRSAQRKDRITGAGGGLAVVAVLAAVAAFAAPGAPGTGRPAPPAPEIAAAGTESVGPATPQAPAPEPPDARAAPVHGRRMYELLRAAVPAGYGARPMYDFSTSTTVYPDPKVPMRPNSIQVLAYGSVLVSRGGGEGSLSAHISYDGKPVPTGNLCAEEVAVRAGDKGFYTTCEVIEVGGVPIRVTTGWDQERRDQKVATRFLKGGRLSVASWQGEPVYEPDKKLPPDAPNRNRPGQQDHKPPLAAPLLDARQVAALAGDPAMLPPR